MSKDFSGMRIAYFGSADAEPSTWRIIQAANALATFYTEEELLDLRDKAIAARDRPMKRVCEIAARVVVEGRWPAT